MRWAVELDENLLEVLRANTAAVFYLIWELAITFDNEVEYIWSKPNSAWIKWVFLFARYFALAIQICTRIIESFIVNGTITDTSRVKIWHICRVLTALVVMLCGEVVLMARVYAMYNRARWAFLFFVFIIVAETAVVVVGIFVSLPHDFQLRDALTSIPLSFSYFGIAILFSQFSIVALSAYKYFSEPWSGEEPLVKVLVRDGSLAFVVASLLSIQLVVYSVLRAEWSVAMYTWFISFTSALACRLILNLQALPPARSIRSDSVELQFTSVFRRTSHDNLTTFNQTYEWISVI